MKRRKSRRRKLGICYLCGKRLDGKVNKDHIPPRQLFPSRARRLNLSRLETRQTHESCNKSYQVDEDYFVDCIASMSDMRPPDIDPLSDVLRRNKKAAKAGTANRQYITELRGRAKSPIYSQEGYILIRPEQQDRINRAIWKIIRGLYFIEHQDKKIVPADTDNVISRPITLRNGRLAVPSLFETDELSTIESLLITLKSRPSKGKYPAIFDYQYDSGSVKQSSSLQRYTWALIFHESVIVIVRFEAQ